MLKLTTAFFITAILPLSAWGNAVLEDELVEKLATADPDEFIHINLVMADRVNPEELALAVEGLPKEAARAYVISALKDKADTTQADLRAYLDTVVSEGSAGDVRYISLNNTVGLFAKPPLIQELSLREDIERINWDPPRFTLFQPPGGGDGRGLAWGVDKIGAPDAWDEGYTGAGVVVAVLDTGCDYEHPDLIGQRWENEEEVSGTPGIDDDGNGYIDDFYGWNFLDDNNDVHDKDVNYGHGTHVTGTIVGDGTMGTQTGVAPEAEFITCVVAPAETTGGYESDVWDAMDYALDNGADIINLSGGLYHNVSPPPHRAIWRETCETLITAGIVLVFAAGNDDVHDADPPPHEVATPADVPCVIAVGATDDNDVLWYSSSKGPTTWQFVPPYNDYPNLIKPAVAAPGVNITSTRKFYENYIYFQNTGTSMAAPHVAGLAALILGDDPDLKPHQVCLKMSLTAFDLGVLGKDNKFGRGRIRCLPAIEYGGLLLVECPAPPKPVEPPPDGE